MKTKNIYSICKTGTIFLPERTAIIKFVKKVKDYGSNNVFAKEMNYVVFYRMNFLGSSDKIYVYNCNGNDENKDITATGANLFVFYLNKTIICDCINNKFEQMLSNMTMIINDVINDISLKNYKFIDIIRQLNEQIEKMKKNLSEVTNVLSYNNFKANIFKIYDVKKAMIKIYGKISGLLDKGATKLIYEMDKQNDKTDISRLKCAVDSFGKKLKSAINEIGNCIKLYIIISAFDNDFSHIDNEELIIKDVILSISIDKTYNLSFIFSDKHNKIGNSNKLTEHLRKQSNLIKYIFQVIDFGCIFSRDNSISKAFGDIKKKNDSASVSRTMCNIAVYFDDANDANNYYDSVHFVSAKLNNYPTNYIYKDELYPTTYFITKNPRQRNYFDQDVCVCHSSLIYTSLALFAYMSFANVLNRFTKNNNIVKRIKSIHSFSKEYSKIEILYSKDNFYYGRQKVIYEDIAKYNDFDNVRDEIKICTENLWHEANMSYSLTFGFWQVIIAEYTLMVTFVSSYIACERWLIGVKNDLIIKISMVIILFIITVMFYFIIAFIISRYFKKKLVI